jgi:hypothetical protein
MKAIVATNQAAGTAGVKLVEGPGPQAAGRHAPPVLPMGRYPCK